MTRIRNYWYFLQISRTKTKFKLYFIWFSIFMTKYCKHIIKTYTKILKWKILWPGIQAMRGLFGYLNLPTIQCLCPLVSIIRQTFGQKVVQMFSSDTSIDILLFFCREFCLKFIRFFVILRFKWLDRQHTRCLSKNYMRTWFVTKVHDLTNF